VSLPAGTRLGVYEILSPLGVGGMGEVYRARDTRLGRKVAVKVLPSEFSTDAGRLRRFEKEARAVSSLQHPNIVAVYDVGQGSGISYIAMELVEGRTLRDMLAAGRMSLRKMLDVSLQIADALAAAHEAGVVHRDIKPSNIVVMRDGFVKLLDFGLAKRLPIETTVDSSVSTESPSDTRSGALVGTVEYMSPEQASGGQVDFRSDQFSLATIMYEMATGRRPFHRDTVAETLVAIVRDDPGPIERPDVPPPLRWLIERCFAKNPDERSASTRDLARDLRELRDHLSEVDSSSRDSGRARIRYLPRGILWASGCVAAVLVAVAVLLSRKTDARHATPVRFPLLPPEHGNFNFDSSAPAPVAVSSDGRRLVYGASDRTGRELLWVRVVEEIEARPLSGTEGATYPFWSPDGEFIGFFGDGKLKKVRVAGGPPQTLGDAPSGRGGSWSIRGVILYAADLAGPLWSIAAAGGAAKPATRLTSSGRGETHRWPSFFPDGRHFLFTVNDQNRSLPEGGVYIGDLESPRLRRLLPDTSNAAYLAPGYVLFARDGALLSAAFDAKNWKMAGEPVPLVDSVDFHPYRWNAIFAGSQSGVLAYASRPSLVASRLTWFDRSGRSLGVVGEPADYSGIRISPAGDRCAAEVRDVRGGTIDVWVIDLARGSSIRLTSGALISHGPTWSPDGSRIAFDSDRSNQWNIYEKPVLGTGAEEVLVSSHGDKSPSDWSPDGRTLVFDVDGLPGKTQHEIWLYRREDRKAIPLLQPNFDVQVGRLSSDGKWIAYVSNETGRSEVYVSPFPKTDRKWRISTSGGTQPVWSKNALELFFVGPGRKLFAVKVNPDPDFHIEKTEPLFDLPVKISASSVAPYDVSNDGSKFLVNAAVEEPVSEPITVVMNWTAGLPR
jgi:serine/threonine protein kinase/Tol biopolymer transport system component